MTWQPPRSTILENFIALCQPTSEISVTKILRTKRQTNSNRYIPATVWFSLTKTKTKTKKINQNENHTAPPCLSACGDNKWNMQFNKWNLLYAWSDMVSVTVFVYMHVNWMLRSLSVFCRWVVAKCFKFFSCRSVCSASVPVICQTRPGCGL